MDTKTPSGRLPLAAACWSAAAVALGSWWWVRPAAYPFAFPDRSFPTLLALVPPSAVGPVLVVAGLLGLVALVSRSRPATIATGSAHAVVFGLLAAGVGPVAMAGYAMAMFGPVVLCATLVAGAWRWRGGPVAVGVVVAVAASAWFSGLADGDVLRRYVDVITGSSERLAGPSSATFLLVGAALWGVLACRLVLVGRERPAWTRPAAAARWGRTAALVAAACALPYALVRMTWLTPWPVGIPESALTTEPEIRLHGLLLGLAAVAGAVLTLGLVARWGEVWPRWVPGLRGRTVPVAAAVVPGALVATLMTGAAVPMAIASFTDDVPEFLLIFPFWLWGPALGVAVVGYAWRRSGQAEVPA